MGDAMDRIEDAAAPEPLPQAEGLSHTLKGRHVQLIAIGGAIGVGLFLGSATAIAQAGPALILGYGVAGLAVFFIMRALGELLLYRPVAGSFAVYAEEFVGPWAGFVTGWSYWFTWMAGGMAEITAVGIYVNFWFPEVPQWLPALALLGLLLTANLIAVRVFGEIEFWFSIVKITTLLLMIVLGLAILLFGIGDLGKTASFGNLWSHGGFFPLGVLGFALTLQLVLFAYQGVELVGVTAGETENPARTLPAAINGITYRILVFYIGALVILMALVPWTEFKPGVSPFVMVFERMGLPAAADLINFVVITAAASSCNSGLFSTGRMLYTLGRARQAPRRFARLSRRHVPAAGIVASAAFMLVGVALNYFVPKQVFLWMAGIAVIGTIWTWSMILVAHLRFRQAVAAGRVPASSFRMPGAPLANWLVLGFLALILGLLGVDAQTRVALYVAPVWFALLTLGYWWSRKAQPAGVPAV